MNKQNKTLKNKILYAIIQTVENRKRIINIILCYYPICGEQKAHY